jgi:hypothetical protein
VAIAFVALTAYGCGARALPCAPAPPTDWGEPPSRNVDLLFMIDNSSLMTAWQARLVDALPAFTQALAAAPLGLPNLHVAVVSSDMGAGTGTGGCLGNGQAGIFQWGAPMTSCAPTSDGAKFLSNINGNANYSGDISDVLSCVAALGEGGCGFEQPFLSLAHALGADNFDSTGRPQPPQENQGFLRDDAYLVIVMLTNEDDCSAPRGAASDLFPRVDDGSNLMSALGPPTGYRCNEFGHLCGNPPAPPPRVSPDGQPTTVLLDDCRPAEDAGRLISVAAFDAVVRALKADPAHQLLVAAITGVYPDPSTPSPSYGVTWARAPVGNELWPSSARSCSAAWGGGAHPAVRISEWVRRLGPSGLLESMCADSLQPAVQRIAGAINQLLEEKDCVSAIFTDPVDCTVTEYRNVDGCEVGTAVRACTADEDARPCWHLDEEGGCRPAAGAPAGTTSRRLIVERDPEPPSTQRRTTIQCATRAAQDR